MWNIVDVCSESSRTARDLGELSKILPKITKHKLGNIEFPKFWIDDVVPRTILTSVLTKLAIEDGYDNIGYVVDIVTSRLDSLINYTKVTFSEDVKRTVAQRRWKLRKFVENVIKNLMEKKVLRLEGEKVLINTDSINDFVETSLSNATQLSTYYIAIVRRFVTMGILTTLGELTESRIKELIHDLNKIVEAWPRKESIEKDLNAILGEYTYFLHVLKLEDWYVFNRFKPLSKLLKEAQELGIDDTTLRNLDELFMNVRAFSRDLIGRLIHVSDLDVLQKIKLIELIQKSLADVVKTGDYIFLYDVNLIVDSRTYRDIVKFIGDPVSVQRAVDALSKIYEKLPIQKDHASIVTALKESVGRLADELYESLIMPYDKFIRGDNKDVKAVLLEALDYCGIIKYDISKNIVEVLDPRALRAIAVLLGVRPVTILLRGK